jgi:hypothetical protein
VERLSERFQRAGKPKAEAAVTSEEKTNDSQ